MPSPNPPRSGQPGREWPQNDADAAVVGSNGDTAVVTDDAAATTTGDAAVAATEDSAGVTSEDAAVAVTDRSAAVTTDDSTVVTTDDTTVVTTDDSTVVSTEDATIVSQPVRARAPEPLPVATPVPPDDPFGRGMLIGLAVLAAAAVAGLAVWLLTRDDEPVTTVTTTVPATTTTASISVAVPALTGLDENTAVAELSSAGLNPNVERRETGGTDGVVVSQAPPAVSEIARGSVVTIVVDAPSPAATPSTSPAATTTTPAQATTTSAEPAAPSTVPDVVGAGEQEAVQSLNEAGLVPSIVFVPSQDPLGTVQGQAKDAGTEVAADSPVQITISKGPGEKPDVAVPDVIGKSLSDALSAIRAEQLRLIYVKRAVETQSEAGKIVKQTPLPGASAPRNGQVLVFMGAYRPGG